MRKTTALAVLAGIAVLALVGCGPAGEGPAKQAAVTTAVQVTPALLAKGKETYKFNCVPCHGPLGKGDGPSAATLNPKPRDHSNPELMDALTDKRIAETVRMGGAMNGYPNMPASPHIRGEELIALVAHVRSLHRGQVDSVDVEGVGQDQ